MFTTFSLEITSLRPAGMLRRPRMARNDFSISSYDHLLRTADRWFAAERFDFAQECYNRASQLRPFRPAAYIGLGCVAVKKGLQDEACVAFEMARWLTDNG